MLLHEIAKDDSCGSLFIHEILLLAVHDVDWLKFFFCEQTWIDSAFLYSEGSIDSAVPIECCLPIGLLFMLGLGPCVEPSEHLKGK
jgi:hypothetical protein